MITPTGGGGGGMVPIPMLLVNMEIYVGMLGNTAPSRKKCVTTCGGAMLY